MSLLVLFYVVLRALWKIDEYIISILVNKSIYYYYYIYHLQVNIHSKLTHTQLHVHRKQIIKYAFDFRAYCQFKEHS